jgi:hypothetical protein
MSLPFFHKDHIDISIHLDFPSELLNLPASSENYILIIGPDLVRREAVPSQGHTHTYLQHLLKGMVVWCTQNKVIQDQDIIHDLHVLLHNGALVPLAYSIEEYLAAAQLKEQCLKAVLNPYSQAEAIHYWLTRFPFRGYITTSYDTCIETAYEETQQGQLGKFYQTSLAHAVDASRKKQPFILKLYGDLAEPDSIKLGHRLLTGLYAEDVRQQLRQLFFETPAIFIGFDDADEDLTALQSLVVDGYNGLQKHSSRAKELYDGITTRPGDQSSPDYTAHEFSPGYHPPGPVIPSQSQDITSKDERSEKETTPDTTRREPARVSASEGQYKSNGTNTDSPPSHPGSTSGHDSQNGQLPHQPPEPSDSNPEPASASTDKTQLQDFKSLLVSRDFQLPDKGVLGKFKSFLRNKGEDLSIKLDNAPGETAPLGKAVKYTRVTRVSKGKEEEEKDVRALIYIPGSTMSKPDPIERQLIIGLCAEFPPDMILIICTDTEDTETCDTDIEGAIQMMKNRKIESGKRIKHFLGLENKTEQVTWINLILEYRNQ